MECRAKVDAAGWDILIYILYDKNYIVQEAYQFDCNEYEKLFSNRKSLRVEDMRQENKLPPYKGIICERRRDRHQFL